MWTESAKWKERQSKKELGVVRFDVFCGHCKKQLGEDVPVGSLETCGVMSAKPMEIFCGVDCAKGYQKSTAKTLLAYGWRSMLEGVPA